MNARERCISAGALLTVSMALWLIVPCSADAHCDTLDGPVIATAKIALEKGEVTPVLKWVKKENEGEIREAFKKTMAVRTKGPEAKELADNYFFETLVRVHRAGEGAPYTGLKSAGTDLGPPVVGADKALETGIADDVVKLITHEVSAGIRERFAEAFEKKKHADESVAAGREFVEAYVTYVHYVEGLYQAARGSKHAHQGEAEQSSKHHDEE